MEEKAVPTLNSPPSQTQAPPTILPQPQSLPPQPPASPNPSAHAGPTIVQPVSSPTIDNPNGVQASVADTCPTCHQPVEPTDYFCPNCGANLKPAPPSTAIADQLTLYFKSILIPPLGYVWGFKYLRQPDSKSKLIGIITYTITTALLIFIVITTIKVINTVNDQVNSQLNQMIF